MADGTDEVLREMAREMGQFDQRFTSVESSLSRVFNRLDAIDNKLSNAAVTDATRTGMVKGGWWLLGTLGAVIAMLASATTFIIKSFFPTT